MMIDRWILIMWACIIAACWPSNALADVRICTQTEAKDAESVAATAKSWMQLHQQFKRYVHCDDGAVAEGFSEAVSLLLTERWGQVSKLGAILKSDPDFRKFVIEHIDETVPANRLKGISKNARGRCPRNLKALCLDFVAAASRT